MKPLLTLDQAIGEDRHHLIIVTEKLRRWLEVRPGISLTLSSAVDSSGDLCAVACWTYEKAPPGLHGSWCAMCPIDRHAWPLVSAIEMAARLVEDRERTVAAEHAREAERARAQALTEKKENP